jgi:hypothetical protein
MTETETSIEDVESRGSSDRLRELDRERACSCLAIQAVMTTRDDDEDQHERGEGHRVTVPRS